MFLDVLILSFRMYRKCNFFDIVKAILTNCICFILTIVQFLMECEGDSKSYHETWQPSGKSKTNSNKALLLISVLIIS